VLTYHLPRAVSWLQHGNLGAYGPEAAFYPGNAELLILMGLFTGTDRLAPLIQAPFLALAGLALFALARTIGARRWSAAIASIVFVASPMAFFHSTVAKNDLIVAALVLSGVLFLLRSLEPDGTRTSERGRSRLRGCRSGSRRERSTRSSRLWPCRP
jgi:4-amino-4-deoxy-L-arabinose transferase-like glycosyltransferase